MRLLHELLFQNFSKSHPEKSVTVQLAIAQLHLSHGVVYKACDALKGLGDLQYKPGVVSRNFREHLYSGT